MVRILLLTQDTLSYTVPFVLKAVKLEYSSAGLAILLLELNTL